MKPERIPERALGKALAALFLMSVALLTTIIVLECKC